MKSLAGLAALTLCASLANASEPIPFDSPRWQISAEENRIEQYKGKNELWFTVSESFGGWGVQAAFADTDGLTIVE